MENNNLKDVFVEGEIIDIVEVSKKGKLLIEVVEKGSTLKKRK